MVRLSRFFHGSILLAAVVGFLSYCAAGQPYGAAVDSSRLEAVEVDERFYDIQGSTAAELHRQMDAKGPTGPDGRFYGRCSWYMRARFYANPRPSDGNCVVTRVPARVDATITLPRWSNYSSASPALQKRWDSFYRGLRRHEMNHLNHGLAAAVEARRQIKALSGRYDCATFKQRALKILRDVPAQYAERDREYDALTNHGATEFKL